jgi:pimeloyl-ACP methyl ester carboxylesterase
MRRRLGDRTVDPSHRREIVVAQPSPPLRIDGTAFEYQIVGAGEPVVLVHGALIADAFAPLLREPALSGRYQLVAYHRRGYAGSGRPDRPLTVADQAADCRRVLRALGIERAHVVGHSFGGAIALQLALDTPALVRSLVLLEAALLAVPSAARLGDALGPVMALYQAGEKAAAVDAFGRAIVAADFPAGLEEAVPGGHAQAVADADTWFAAELGALQEWRFGRDDARRITQPALAVVGADSGTLWPGWVEGYELTREWLPQAEGFVLPGAAHALQMQNPRDLADAIAAFLARVP